MGKFRAEPRHRGHSAEVAALCFPLILGTAALVVEMARAVLAIGAPGTAHSSVSMVAVMAGALVAGYALAYFNASLTLFLRRLGLLTTAECRIHAILPVAGAAPRAPTIRVWTAFSSAPGHPRAPPHDFKTRRE